MFRAWQQETSEYVTGFADELFKEGGITDAEVPFRVNLWANKTLDDIYYTALREAGPHVEDTWKVDPDKDHCDSCVTRNGQTKTVEEWGKIGFPRDRRLDCGGWDCGCDIWDKNGNRLGAR